MIAFIRVYIALQIFAMSYTTLRSFAGDLILTYSYCQGKNEYIGRVITHAIVKRSDQAYEMPEFPPSLVWHDIKRGEEEAGQLLSALELLQVHD